MRIVVDNLTGLLAMNTRGIYTKSTHRQKPGSLLLITQYNELIRSEMDKHTMLQTYAGRGWKDMKKRMNIVKYKSVKQWRQHPRRCYASLGKIRQRVWVVLEDKNECGME